MKHDQFCYQPADECWYLTCTCPCHPLCPIHGYREPCFECRILEWQWHTP